MQTGKEKLLIYLFLKHSDMQWQHFYEKMLLRKDSHMGTYLAAQHRRQKKDLFFANFYRVGHLGQMFAGSFTYSEMLSLKHLNKDLYLNSCSSLFYCY